ncbi:MAG: hypothetical protein M1122_03340 [Candidatus Marsarchaeota archaeon]|jgi:hypothetical protein|nr:hypothetical protein [Candidatus Marsarchaeota archaeon]
MNTILKTIVHYTKIPIVLLATSIFLKPAEGAMYVFDIIGTLSAIQNTLMHIGPMISAVLFILAGIFYSLGQLFPPSRKAKMHSTAIDIIVGAIVIAVLSVASTSLAVASTHLLSNTIVNITG